MPLRYLTISLIVFLSAAVQGCQSAQFGETMVPGAVISPRAKTISQPVPVNKVDAAAIWIHPTDPASSFFLVSNELHGIELHDMDGLLQKVYDDDDFRPNNLGLIYDFPLNGAETDLALVSCTTPDSAGVKVFKIDPAKRRLTEITSEHLIKVFDGAPPAGLCAYHSRKTGKSFFFATSRSGKIEQCELIAKPDGSITANRVRTLDLGSKGKFGVADEERGLVYFGEEKAGVRRFNAEPDADAASQLVVNIGENGLIADVVGVALYCAAEGRGYLIVVSQGPKGGLSTLKVYERQGNNRFILTIDPSAEEFGKLERISGIAVTNRPTISLFPRGVLAANDRINPNASEDYKLYSWEDIATPGGLLMDTTWSPRAQPVKK
jgi:3-phytase